MVREPSSVETFFERLTAWVGSVPSLIVHTLAFLGAFLVAVFHYAPWDMVLLIVTTVVSLEAIYLAIFIQMTVNRQARDLHDVTEDVEEIQEDVEEISKDVDEIQEDVEEISKDVDEIQEDVEEMSEEHGPLSSPDSVSAQDTISGALAEIRELLAKIESTKSQHEK